LVFFQVKHAAVMFCSLVPSSLGFESNEEEFKSLNQVQGYLAHKKQRPPRTYV